jgi:peptidoglycan/xylan/chitin deacetylase (PgdA/CDA1 family)
MRDQHLILTFHGIGEPPPSVDGSELSVWVDRNLFEATLDEVSRRGGIEITFDDGNRSDLEIALPELRRRGLTAKFFIVAARLGEPGYLSADELGELVAGGMVVGSHGLHHRSWRSLDDGQLDDDLRQGRAILEDALGSSVTQASCPFGEYDRRVLKHLRRSGHERVYTSDGGGTRRDGWLQARNTVGSDWGPPGETLGRRDGARAALLRTAKRTAKRWR